jgi:hypothetical protein
MDGILEGVVGLLLIMASAIAIVGVPLLIYPVEFERKEQAQEPRVCTWEPFAS